MLNGSPPREHSPERENNMRMVGAAELKISSYVVEIEIHPKVLIKCPSHHKLIA
jgi:hypothetical protein